MRTEEQDEERERSRNVDKLERDASAFGDAVEAHAWDKVVELAESGSCDEGEARLAVAHELLAAAEALFCNKG